jgi:hypothetical protein
VLQVYSAKSNFGAKPNQTSLIDIPYNYAADRREAIIDNIFVDLNYFHVYAENNVLPDGKTSFSHGQVVHCCFWRTKVQ